MRRERHSPAIIAGSASGQKPAEAADNRARPEVIAAYRHRKKRSAIRIRAIMPMSRRTSCRKRSNGTRVIGFFRIGAMVGSCCKTRQDDQPPLYCAISKGSGANA